MNNELYQHLASRTCANPDPAYCRMTMEMVELTHVGDGLATEAGEFIDALKKHIFYGKPLDRVNLAEELGDILWYVAYAARLLETTIDNIQEANIAKLRLRYPEKFTEAKAEHRDLVGERNILDTANLFFLL